MATATQVPTPKILKICFEPLTATGEVITRGKTSTKVATEFVEKMDYVLRRSPKLTAIRTLTTIEGDNTPTMGFYTSGKDGWQYCEQFPGTTVLPTPTKQTAQGTVTKTKKKAVTTPRSETAKGKPGVINEIVSLLKGSVDAGGVTVKEMVLALASKFPSRPVEGMEITVRCQLGRIPKQRKLKIGKQKDPSSKEVRYFIS